jgi:hypothetical protein
VFPPYGALAGELILGNEGVIECDGLAQGGSLPDNFFWVSYQL